jgi:C4-dicarboxylate-specific signal transduction histidine kinase
MSGILGAIAVALGVPGWLAAAGLLAALRRRRARVAEAEHELRGAAAVIGLAAERVARTGMTAPFAALVRLQLDRIDAALVDLGGGRPPADLDAARLAQVLANLIANAAEHGDGPVAVESERVGGALRLTVRNGARPGRVRPGGARPGRGRGLAIAARAARQLGGELTLETVEDGAVARLELPERPAEDVRRAA